MDSHRNSRCRGGRGSSSLHEVEEEDSSACSIRDDFNNATLVHQSKSFFPNFSFFSSIRRPRPLKLGNLRRSRYPSLQTTSSRRFPHASRTPWTTQRSRKGSPPLSTQRGSMIVRFPPLSTVLLRLRKIELALVCRSQQNRSVTTRPLYRVGPRPVMLGQDS